MPAETLLRKRLRLRVRGTVQGVGFRPFVYRVALELGLDGWVANDSAGAVIEVEGEDVVLQRLLRALREEAPPHARITGLEPEWLEPTLEHGFHIRPSDASGEPTALVLPDLATCDACLAELRQQGERRAGYAFTNCTHCGPRFTIIRSLPYDRPNTTMAGFTLCPDCRAEYDDPADRRFHAQPIACPTCGPRLALLDASGQLLLEVGQDAQAVLAAAAAIVRGQIVALKGIGGFLLLCDARNEVAVQRLRQRKRRPTKPFAVMVRDIPAAAALVRLDGASRALLRQPAAPIVLLRRLPGCAVAPGVAPGNPNLGVMLPCAPLLHLLMQAAPFPLIATSGNLSEEPICITAEEALERLGGVADFFLTHDRPIQRHVDDSVCWIVDGAPALLRRARGFAPLPIRLSASVPPLLAVGGQLKNTVAVARDHDVFISQHIGDLDSHQSQHAFVRVIEDLIRFYHIEPAAIAHDLHPDYSSTYWARAAASTHSRSDMLIPVQHHHAHLASCLAEHGYDGTALGIIWDGTGYGTDGTIWGGEFLLGDANGFKRVGTLRPFRLPGGDAAVREPDRVAFSLLYQLLGEAALDVDLPVVRRMAVPRRRLLRRMIDHGINTPVTSSAGRLFDGVAALLGLGSVNSYEAEAAIALQYAAAPSEKGSYPLPIGAHGVLDWRPLLHDLLEDLRDGVERARIAARFHNGMVKAAVAIADRAGSPIVALSGGCFQNRLLTERLAAALRARHFNVLLHRQVPCNDGGISLGQIAVAAARLRQKEG